MNKKIWGCWTYLPAINAMSLAFSSSHAESYLKRLGLQFIHNLSNFILISQFRIPKYAEFLIPEKNWNIFIAIQLQKETTALLVFRIWNSEFRIQNSGFRNPERIVNWLKRVQGPSISDVGKFSQFLTTTPLQLAFFDTIHWQIWQIFEPLPPKKYRRLLKLMIPCTNIQFIILKNRGHFRGENINS